MSKCINYNDQVYNVNELTRLQEDKCYIKKRNTDALHSGKYHLANFHECGCEASRAKKLSLQQASTYYRDGIGWVSNNGCNIDNDSKLRNANNLTNQRGVHQLFPRAISTVPYMGRGGGNTCVESRLRPGETTSQQKSCNSLSGAFINSYTPQIPCIRSSIQNPKYNIPEDSDDSWVRGGQPSRQIIRNTDYLNKCGFNYNGKYWERT